VNAPPVGSLSIDLDDEWSYRRSLGDPGWTARSSYFPVLAPRLDEVLEGRRATCFAVGVDARRPEIAALLGSLHARGHEIASHSDSHDPYLRRRGRARIEQELSRSAEAIRDATGSRPVGYRAPGFGTSREVRAALAGQGYRYDASAFPSPVAIASRTWFGRHEPHPRIRAADVRDGVAELAGGARPRRVVAGGHALADVPVTVMPYARLPIHSSYLLLWGARFPDLALRYLELALAICARRGVGPALVVHPTDLLDGTDTPALRRLPGMRLPASRKLALVRRWLAAAEARFALGTVAAQAAAVMAAGG
jgi:peptidoglycan/xylan/chitin deacetylase (PgdA/CDA1 family)